MNTFWSIELVAIICWWLCGNLVMCAGPKPGTITMVSVQKNSLGDMVGIGKFVHFCGGTLITTSVVFTGCSCISTKALGGEDEDAKYKLELLDTDQIRVVAGVSEVKVTKDTKSQTAMAFALSMHPLCDGKYAYNYGLIKTANAFRLDNGLELSHVLSLDITDFEKKMFAMKPGDCWTETWVSNAALQNLIDSSSPAGPEKTHISETEYYDLSSGDDYPDFTEGYGNDIPVGPPTDKVTNDEEDSSGGASEDYSYDSNDNGESGESGEYMEQDYKEEQEVLTTEKEYLEENEGTGESPESGEADESEEETRSETTKTPSSYTTAMDKITMEPTGSANKPTSAEDANEEYDEKNPDEEPYDKGPGSGEAEVTNKPGHVVDGGNKSRAGLSNASISYISTLRKPMQNLTGGLVPLPTTTEKATDGVTSQNLNETVANNNKTIASVNNTDGGISNNLPSNATNAYPAVGMGNLTTVDNSPPPLLKRRRRSSDPPIERLSHSNKRNRPCSDTASRWKQSAQARISTNGRWKRQDEIAPSTPPKAENATDTSNGTGVPPSIASGNISAPVGLNATGAIPNGTQEGQPGATVNGTMNGTQGASDAKGILKNGTSGIITSPRGNVSSGGVSKNGTAGGNMTTGLKTTPSAGGNKEGVTDKDEDEDADKGKGKEEDKDKEEDEDKDEEEGGSGTTGLKTTTSSDYGEEVTTEEGGSSYAVSASNEKEDGSAEVDESDETKKDTKDYDEESEESSEYYGDTDSLGSGADSADNVGDGEYEGSSEKKDSQSLTTGKTVSATGKTESTTGKPGFTQAFADLLTAKSIGLKEHSGTSKASTKLTRLQVGIEPASTIEKELPRLVAHLPVNFLDWKECRSLVCPNALVTCDSEFHDTKWCISSTKEGIQLCTADTGAPLYCKNALAAILSNINLFCPPSSTKGVAVGLDGAFDYIKATMGMPDFKKQVPHVETKMRKASAVQNGMSNYITLTLGFLLTFILFV